MILRKRECLRRNIDGMLRRRESGQAGWVTGLFLTLFLAVLLYAMLLMEQYRAAALYLEDALTASNLASAVIDVEEYGISHTILIANPQEAYERYLWAVKGNLNLDDRWKGADGSLIEGPVEVVNYTVYNVRDDGVAAYRFDGNGVLSQWQESLSGAKAPNNVPILSTSVYSELKFEMGGFPGMRIEAYKGNLVDITS